MRQEDGARYTMSDRAWITILSIAIIVLLIIASFGQNWEYNWRFDKQLKLRVKTECLRGAQ